MLWHGLLKETPNLLLASEVVEASEKEADLQCPFCENPLAHWSAKEDRTMSLTEFVEAQDCIR